MNDRGSYCSRCNSTLPVELPRKGMVYKALLRHKATTVRHGLKFNMWRLTPWTKNPGDQVKLTYTELDLCNKCAADVFLYAQGKEEDDA